MPARAERRGPTLKKAFSKFTPQSNKKSDTSRSSSFVFCERSGGAAQFRAESTADLDCTVERMAGLLAMQCLVRGTDPGDFEILVAAERGFASRLQSRAKELLDEGRAVASPSCLSPRQQEILHSVIRNQANKEIASKLNITVRTVKFHISSLLNRFGVENRAELASRAAGFLRPVIGGMNPEPASEGPGRRALGPVAYALGTFDGNDRKDAFESIRREEHSAVHTQ
jgi:DNA-binding CsgD family transcriptional regulator